jgi:hypothetical protein
MTADNKRHFQIKTSHRPTRAISNIDMIRKKTQHDERYNDGFSCREPTAPSLKQPRRETTTSVFPVLSPCSQDNKTAANRAVHFHIVPHVAKSYYLMMGVATARVAVVSLLLATANKTAQETFVSRLRGVTSDREENVLKYHGSSN